MFRRPAYIVSARKRRLIICGSGYLAHPIPPNDRSALYHLWIRREEAQEERRRSLSMLSGYVCRARSLRRPDAVGVGDSVLSTKTKRRRRKRSPPVSNAATGSDHFLAVGLVTPPALVTATRRRCRR